MGMVLDEVHYGMQATVHGTAVLVGRTIVVAQGALLIACHMHGMPYHLVHALISHGGNGDDGYAEQRLHLVDAHGTMVVLYLVHHVEGQYHGDAKFHQLHGQVQVALYARCIHYVDDG